MPDTDFVDVARSSRYKDTPVYQGHVTFEFGLLEVPPEFDALRDGDKAHRVARNDIGFLDGLAVTYYGPGNEKFWWVIALVNGIIDPDRDMFVGQVLTIPSRSTVLEFAARVPIV